MIKLEVVAYECERLAFFAKQRKFVQKKYDRLEREIKPDEPYLSERRQDLSDLGRVLSFYNDVIKMLEDDICTPKERGADKPKITCLNCKHLMFSDCYGECNKQLRIVNSSDTCEYAEPKEREDNDNE